MVSGISTTHQAIYRPLYQTTVVLYLLPIGQVIGMAQTLPIDIYLVITTARQELD
jgi:hypothetical protein